MYSLNLRIKTMTTLEFSDIPALTFDIAKKIFPITANDDSRTYALREGTGIRVLTSGTLSVKNNTRLKYSSGISDADRHYYTESVFYIPKETDFKLEIVINNDVYKESIKSIIEFIKKLNEGRIRLGDNTTLGKGLCVCQVVDTLSPEIISDIRDSHYSFNEQNICDRIVVSAHCENGLYIDDQIKKDNGSNDWPEEYTIPASTWKGVFRNASNDWVKYLGEDAYIINKMFGNHSLGMKGCLIFYDSIISDPEMIKNNRMPINKFSASALSEKLINREYAAGSFEIIIECTESIEPYKKYIFTVLRDLNTQRINVGADKGIGKGFISIDNVDVYSNL